jgi:hypothetical protein
LELLFDTLSFQQATDHITLLLDVVQNIVSTEIFHFHVSAGLCGATLEADQAITVTHSQGSLDPPGAAHDFNPTTRGEQSVQQAANDPLFAALHARTSTSAATAATSATAAAQMPAQAGNASVIVIPDISRCAAWTNTSGSGSGVMRFALNLSSIVGRLTGFPADCIPTKLQQQRNSSYVLVFTAELCTLAGTQTGSLLHYTNAQLMSAVGRLVRNANNVLCSIRNTARLARATADRIFGSGCGVAPTIANGTLPQAVCVEQTCGSSDGPNPASDDSSAASASPSPSPSTAAAGAAVASPAPTNSTAADDGASGLDVSPNKGGGKRPGSVVYPCKGGGKRPGSIGRFVLSNVVIGPLCCTDAAVNALFSK